MILFQRFQASWGKDRLLGRVVRNSGYLFASNAISAVLSILTANLLGVAQFGALGMIISFVSSINRILSFRMGELVVRYMGDYLAKGEKQKAAAIVKAAGLAEAITSVTAFLVLLFTAPLGAKFIIHDSSISDLIVVYGLSILGMMLLETSTGVLQVGGNFRGQSVINLIQALVTATGIVYAYITQSGVMVVLLAYLSGKLITGIGPFILAINRMRELFGKEWIYAPMRELPSPKEIIKFALSTNISGTINMVVRDSELLWVGGIFNAQAAGYYKTALAVINLLIMPINPFIATTYPEITRTISQKMWPQLKQLLRRVTVIAAGWTLLVAAGLFLLGEFLLFTPWIPWKGSLVSIYKPEYLPSLNLILILLFGYGAANSLYWNRSLLLAFGQADIPLRIAWWGMVAKVLLTVTVVPLLGYESEAVLLSIYLALTVGIMVWRGWSLINAQERQPV